METKRKNVAKKYENYKGKYTNNEKDKNVEKDKDNIDITLLVITRGLLVLFL